MYDFAKTIKYTKTPKRAYIILCKYIKVISILSNRVDTEKNDKSPNNLEVFNTYM